MKLYNVTHNLYLYVITLFVLFYMIGIYAFQPNDQWFIDHENISKLARHEEIKNEKIKTIVEVLWCENRTSKTSMELVLSVVLNRAKDKTLDGVYMEIIKPYQFSCLNNETIIQSAKLKMESDLVRYKIDLKMYKVAEEIVQTFLNGKFKSIISAKYYYAPLKVPKPKYLEDKPLILAFEDHDFH